MLCLFNISHFSLTVCSESMAKRLQQDSGEERVTAKSRPMLSLIARVPSNISSSISESSVKRSCGNQNPWSVKAERERIDWCNPLWAATSKPRLTIIMNSLLKALSQHATQSGMMTKLGLLKSGKLTLRCVIDRGNPLWSLKEEQGHSNLSLKRCHRMRIFSGIQIILKQGEWSSAEKTKTIFYECYRRRRKTFYDMVNVSVCNNGISSIHGKELPEH